MLTGGPTRSAGVVLIEEEHTVVPVGLIAVVGCYVRLRPHSSGAERLRGTDVYFWALASHDLPWGQFGCVCVGRCCLLAMQSGPRGKSLESAERHCRFRKFAKFRKRGGEGLIEPTEKPR